LLEMAPIAGIADPLRAASLRPLEIERAVSSSRCINVIQRGWSPCQVSD